MNPLFKNIKFLFLFLYLSGTAQEIKLSGYEKRWAFFHPCAAIKVKKISKRCFMIYTKMSLKLELDSFTNGGKLDAFRHAFFMAAFAQKIKATKIRKLGIAHEKANYRAFKRSKLEYGESADSLSCIMDLRNNEVGITIGRTNKQIDMEELQTIVIKEIKAGHAFIMKRKSSGIYLDCESNAIRLGNYSKKWNVPKCLVASNFVYID